MLIFFSRITLAISPNFPTRHSLVIQTKFIQEKGHVIFQGDIIANKGGSSDGALGAPPPFWNFWKFWLHNTQFNFIVINMQCLQYVFYSLFSLQKHRVCLKGYQNNLQTSKTIPRRDNLNKYSRLVSRYPRHYVYVFEFQSVRLTVACTRNLSTGLLECKQVNFDY